MSNRTKNIFYSLFLLLAVGGVYLVRSCSEAPQEPAEANQQLLVLEGTAQGSTYQIKYIDTQKRMLKPQIDSILRDFDLSLSAWVADSELSRFNAAGTDTLYFRYPYFYEVLRKSEEVFRFSQGAFDPTVAPLAEAYGFGFKKAQSLAANTIDSLLQFVSMDYIGFDEKKVYKKKKGVSLDFNAIAQGYSVDVLAAYLQSQGIENFMVELGGEVMCRGRNPEGNIWKIGIKNPILAEKGQVALHAAISLDGQGLATSGNYEKFYVKDGKKYAHILNPKTGQPVFHSVLSATVIAPDAMTADAFATLFMVLSLEESKAILAKEKDLEAYLIFADEQGELQGYMSDGIRQMVEEVKPQQ